MSSALERLQIKIEELISNYELLKIENAKLTKRLQNPSFDQKEQQDLIKKLQIELDQKDEQIDLLIAKVEELLEA
jgi:regulator of replication initiation timing